MIRFVCSNEWDTELDPHLYIHNSHHSSTNETCWFVAITSFIENHRDMKCDTQAFAHTQARGRPRTRSPLTTQWISPITDFPYAFLNFQLHLWYSICHSATASMQIQANQFSMELFAARRKRVSTYRWFGNVASHRDPFACLFICNTHTLFWCHC